MRKENKQMKKSHKILLGASVAVAIAALVGFTLGMVSRRKAKANSLADAEDIPEDDLAPDLAEAEEEE